MLATKRLQKEAKALHRQWGKHQIRAKPLENNILEFHYCIEGPVDTPYGTCRPVRDGNNVSRHDKGAHPLYRDIHVVTITHASVFPFSQKVDSIMVCVYRSECGACVLLGGHVCPHRSCCHPPSFTRHP